MAIRASLAARTKRALLIVPRGGLLIVSGPPLGGKGPLAAALEESLPNCLKLEAVDNLSVAGQSYRPRTQSGKTLTEVEPAILRDAVRCLQTPNAVPPLVLVCARFPTAALRRQAAEVAVAASAKFLLVEAISSPIRSLRRVSRLILPPDEMARRFAAYESARRAYEALTGRERASLPAVTFKSVLSDLGGTVQRVVAAWHSR